MRYSVIQLGAEYKKDHIDLLPLRCNDGCIQNCIINKHQKSCNLKVYLQRFLQEVPMQLQSSVLVLPSNGFITILNL